MKKVIFSKTYKINSTEIDSGSRLHLVALLNMIQDVASEHANALGFGYSEMWNSGIFWVLVRQKLKINYWPLNENNITLKTWTKPVDGIFAIREFQFYIGNRLIGNCSTSWMILDFEKRKPQNLAKVANKFTPRLDFQLDYVAQKIIPQEPFERIGEITVNHDDLDQNNHVNNVRYTQWIIELLPHKIKEDYNILEYEINFLEEVYLNENVTIGAMLPLTIDEAHDIYFKAHKSTSNKAVFICRFSIQRNGIDS